ncbi:MAG: aromatic aminobenezylarsenical efflux permease ArsG family transporter [Candidatus Omnitrophica bacterium]|nr:aromatic aminobenezylarsenical efflux permease ArsG family transporter [Candidatus Omnitrophota bacterium]
MDGILIAAASALWLGILTSISPCPLAANITAISFLARKIAHPKIVFFSGLAYTAGRMISYALLGIIIANSLLSVPTLANWLQRYINKVFGIILTLTGLFLLDILKLNFKAITISARQQDKLAGAGIGGAFALGLFFALAFCPISAALFFGSLIPLALKYKPGALLPLIYGIGTGLPVLLFAFLIALGISSLNRWFKWMTRIEYIMRKATGLIFILAGIYYIWVYLLKKG